MSKEAQAILERVEAHLRAAKRIALETDDAAAFHADEDAIATIQDALKVVKAEQQQLERDKREQSRQLRLVAPVHKRRIRQAGYQLGKAA
jgi:hypothetical protein